MNAPGYLCLYAHVQLTWGNYWGQSDYSWLCGLGDWIPAFAGMTELGDPAGVRLLTLAPHWQ